MQLSRAAPLSCTQLRSIARKVARVSAFAPVGLVADDDVLIWVASFFGEVLLPLAGDVPAALFEYVFIRVASLG